MQLIKRLMKKTVLTCAQTACEIITCSGRKTAAAKGINSCRLIIPIVLCLSIIQSFAQTRAIDSINRLIAKARTDTERINLVNKKVRWVGEINIDSSLDLAGRNIADARKINYKKGEAGALLSMAGNYSLKGDYLTAKQQLEQAEKISASLKDSFLIANVYAGYGMMYGIKGKYDTSILYYEKCIQIDERLGNVSDLGSSYGNLAIGYQMLSNFPVALMYQQKSLSVAEQHHDISSQAYTLMNMGNTYQNIGDTAKAEQAILRGIGLAKDIGIKNVELYGYANLASLYDLLHKWDKSYSFAMQAATLAKTMGDKGIEASSISKAALALAKTKEYAKAEALNKNALAIADSSAQPFNIFQVYAAMGSILTMQAKYLEAIPFLEKSVNMLKEGERYDGAIADAYEDLSLCYEKTGNYNKALTTYKLSAEIHDSIRSKENIRKATELSMNYEFEKKQTVADAIQGKKNAEARLKQWLLLAGLGVALIIATGTLIAFRNKQKANAILQLQKTEIQSTLNQLTSTQAQLIQSEKMASLGELTAGIAHEIQNPLNFVNNFSEINKELIEEMKNELLAGNVQEAISLVGHIVENEEKIMHHGKRADSIVKGMLQHSRVNTGQKQPTDVNALADEYLRLSYHGLRARDKSFKATIQTDFDQNLSAGEAGTGKINIATQDIGRVLLNLLNNAFYAVNEKSNLPAAGDAEDYTPTVLVATRKTQQKVLISVKDNGTGIPKKVLDKVFQPFFTTKPTGRGTGLGLSLSYDIIKTHGGEIKVYTEEGMGTEFVIQLPIS